MLKYTLPINGSPEGIYHDDKLILETSLYAFEHDGVYVCRLTKTTIPELIYAIYEKGALTNVFSHNISLSDSLFLDNWPKHSPYEIDMSYPDENHLLVEIYQGPEVPSILVRFMYELTPTFVKIGSMFESNWLLDIDS